MSLELPILYPITDTQLSGLSHAEQVRQLAEGGATLIQLRDKHMPPRAFYEAALEARAVADRFGVRLIINDRVDVALAAGADGVHLGQDDLPVDEARKLLGPERVIGFSTHNLEQAKRADATSADYIAIGPVFHTTTKENPDPVVGPELIRQAKSALSKPLVAIGGITLPRAQAALDAGADSLAVISDLYQDGRIAERVRAFLNLRR